MANAHFYLSSKEDIIQQFNTSSGGLSQEEVAKRKEQHGPNQIPEKKGQSFLKIFISQFTSVMVLILMGSGVITIALGEHVDAVFIFLIVFINGIMGAWQEWKAEQNASALSKMVEVKAKVIREGTQSVIDAKEIVPGDIIKLESGDKVPADLRLIESNGLHIEEAMLTGESVPVEKSTETLTQDNLSLGDQHNMAFSGTAVTSGRATGVVVGTALTTEIGKIAGQMNNMDTNKPPLVHRMEIFSRNISIYTLILCCIAGVIAYMQGNTAYEVFFLVIALAVSAIPEGLPIAITVALSIGSMRMSKRNVIIRKLAAVEGLGSCTIIATDKTGTLTVDQQTVHKIHLPSGAVYTFSGVGYAGEGEVTLESGPENKEGLDSIIRSMILCNEATLAKKETKWEHHGDAVDVALLAAAHKHGASPDEIRKGHTIVQEIPFESDRKYSGVVITLETEKHLMVKGAFEAFQSVLENGDEIKQQVEKLSADGYRVIVLADAKVADAIQPESLPRLTMLGLIALIDPIREEVKPAIAKCLKAGIKVAMITGDHPATALFIAKDIGIAASADQVISGADLTAFQDAEGNIKYDAIANKTVFARVSPQQKYKIVEAFKNNKNFVAVTGDGVNDAPALKTANIGAAMGYGTDVAKEAASMIVTDNNFASITSAVEEGRFIYSNIRKVVYLLISTGFAEIFTIILALAFSVPIPFTAIQLLWMNLVTNGIQDVAISFEKGEPDEMNKPPRHPDEPIFDKRMIQQVVISGTFISLVVFGVWEYMINELGLEAEHSRSTLLLLMVIFQNVHVINCRSEHRSSLFIPFRNNYYLFGAIILAQGIHIGVSFIPFIANPLGLSPYTLKEWGIMMLLAATILLVMELFKVYVRWQEKKRPVGISPKKGESQPAAAA